MIIIEKERADSDVDNCKGRGQQTMSGILVKGGEGRWIGQWVTKLWAGVEVAGRLGKYSGG